MRILKLLTLVLALALLPSPLTTTASAATLTIPATSYLGANQVTLNLTSSATGTGYFTLLNGSGVPCGVGTQVKVGQTAGGAAAPYHGSLPLIAATTAPYTVRNLPQSRSYTVCFTADDGTTLDATPVTVAVATTAALPLVNPDWANVGTAGFSASYANLTSLSFAPDGTPYVAYQDAGNGSKATVMKYTGTGASGWTSVGSAGFSAGIPSISGTISLSFAPDGTPYVAYRDSSNSGKATVMKYTGTGATGWTPVGLSFSSAIANSTSLSFAPDGTPYVAYQDAFNGSKATVMKYTGTGATGWTSVGSAGFSADAASYTSPSFAPDGTPYVACMDTSKSNKATVMKYTGTGVTGWAPVGSDGFSAAVATYTSLSFAPDATPYVAYVDGAVSPTTTGAGGKATLMKFDGSSWGSVGSVGFSAAVTNYTSLAIAPDGTPYVAYKDGAVFPTTGAGTKATVMKFDGTRWSNAGSAGFSAGSISFTSLSVAPDGAPYVAYVDGGKSSKSTLMKLSAGTTTSVTSNLNPATVGGTIIFTAAVTPIAATGTVMFSADGSAMGTGTLSGGSATYNTSALVVGSHTITAVYSGGDNYLGSTATALTQTVNKNSQTITFNNPGDQIIGTTLTLTASASSLLAPTFSTATAGVCTVTTGGLLSIIATGSCTINADQSGNVSCDPAPMAQQSFTVLVPITIATTPAGVAFTVYTSPHDFTWPQGDTHTVTMATIQPGATTGYRSIFKSWTDATLTPSRVITVGAAATTYTAQFDSQYQITTAVVPAANGYVLPLNGTWYPAGSSVNVSVTPNNGNHLSGWSGPVTNAASAATTVTMSGPVSVTANLVGIPALRSRVSMTSGLLGSRLWIIDLTNSGTGIATNVKISGVTLTRTSGTPCTPVVKTSLPLMVTDVAQGATQSGGVTIDFTGCAITNRYTVMVNFSNGDVGSGAFTGATSSANMYR
jgi:Bacterial Ig-like domain (group 3)/Divergent InlB B-repeat domain